MDIEYLLALQNLRESLPDFVTSLAAFVSDIVSGPIVIVVAVILFWCVNKRLGYFLAAAFCMGSAVNQLVKNIACVYRPWILDSRVEVAAPAVESATGYSFPSGHTTSAVGFYGGLAVWFRSHRVFVALMIGMVLLTAFTRNFLGCHTPQDVLVALALSSLVLFCVYVVSRYLEKHPEKDIAIAVAGLVLCAVALAFTALKGYPLDYDAAGVLLVDPWEMQTDCFRAFGAAMGFLLGWVIERRLIKFDSGGTAKARVIRGLVGVALLAVLYALVLPAALGMLDVHVHKFLEYFLLLLFAVVAYPALVKWQQNRSGASADAQE